MEKIPVGLILALVIFFGVSDTILAYEQIKEDQTSEQTQEKKVTYFCPMHPDTRQIIPGKCPKCGMDLVPESSGSDEKVEKDMEKAAKSEHHHHH